MDRRALVIGSWLAQGRDKPSPQRVKSLTDRWLKLFEEDRYKFRSLKDPQALPVPLHNPKIADLVAELSDAASISSQTELLLYFVGHSVSFGEDDIRLILGLDANGVDRTISMAWLLQTIMDQTPLRKLAIVMDTCHAGRIRNVFQKIHATSFTMVATGDAYAFDASFSEGFLNALDYPVRKGDPRIDRIAKGITYQRIFEIARSRVLSASQSQQDPKCFGDYGNTILLEAPVSVPVEFNSFVSNRSIYNRLFCLLRITERKKQTFSEIVGAVRENPVFLLRRENGSATQYLSNERLTDYLDFLRKAKWVVQPNRKFELTAAGQDVCRTENFNQILLQTIEREIFEDGISLTFLDEIIRELLVDMIPPTPARIKERAGMKGKLIDLDSATRVAMQLLPSTGRFLKGASDAIFPCELGG